jgi:4-carboxymuconolactone decarboxylase
MPRLPELRREDLSPEQDVLFQAIASTRGEDIALTGPFRIWMESPQIGDACQRLGEQVRYRSSLPPRLSELAILVCARHWRADFEWHVHARIAQAAGVAGDVIRDVRQGRSPQTAAADERAVHDVAQSLLRNGRVAEETYQAALELVSLKGIVDLTALVGYYTLVAMTLNAFEVLGPTSVDWTDG